MIKRLSLQILRRISKNEGGRILRINWIGLSLGDKTISRDLVIPGQFTPLAVLTFILNY